jgi:hypothetical protein
MAGRVRIGFLDGLTQDFLKSDILSLHSVLNSFLNLERLEVVELWCLGMGWMRINLVKFTFGLIMLSYFLLKLYSLNYFNSFLFK